MTTTHDRCLEASRAAPIDTRSAQQRAFDKNAADCAGIANRMARYMADPRWAKDAKTVWLISDMSSELERKLGAIRMDGPVKSVGGA